MSLLFVWYHSMGVNCAPKKHEKNMKPGKKKKKLSSVRFLYWELDKISCYLFWSCFTVLEFTIYSDILIPDLSPFINTFYIWLFQAVICKVCLDSTERKQSGICWLSLNIRVRVQKLAWKNTHCQDKLHKNNLKFIYVKPTCTGMR